MTTFSISITKRTRTRRLSGGRVVTHDRHVLNYTDPATGARRQEFFAKRDDARARRNRLLARAEAGAWFQERTAPTVAEAIDHWLADREGNIKANTLAGYQVVAAHVRKGLGARKVADLTTAEIRSWHRAVSGRSGAYTANRAISHLRAILALAEEDYGVRPPSMPRNLGRGPAKAKKAILTTAQVAQLVSEAQRDPYGVYYAFPFLAGTRPSEQLGLLWDEVDFDRNVVHICRIQERDGSLAETTKTDAGRREVPMPSVLREMLLAWRLRCPRAGDGELHRVFPGLGRLQKWPLPRQGGGPLYYMNFLRRRWRPVFERLGLPYVTPHSARHSFISTLQAQGIEVGLVAKLAGHANPNVTLGHYTQAVRGGAEAMNALASAYELVGSTSAPPAT